jgi:hypothetical protein
VSCFICFFLDDRDCKRVHLANKFSEFMSKHFPGVSTLGEYFYFSETFERETLFLERNTFRSMVLDYFLNEVRI